MNENVMLWVQTDTPSYHMAKHYGDAKIIEDAGGKIYHQTCWGMNQLAVPAVWGKNFNVLTNSFKQYKIFGGYGNGTRYDSTEECINAAVTGKYVPSRWTKKCTSRVCDIDEFKPCNDDVF